MELLDGREVVRRPQPAGEQQSEVGYAIEGLRRRGGQDAVGSSGQHEQRDEQGHGAAEADLEDPVQGRHQRPVGMAGRGQQQDHGGDGGHAIGGLERRQQGQRREHDGQRQAQAGHVAMRNGQGYRHAPDRSADGADDAVEGRLQGPADAGLHDDDGGEHRPVALGQMQQVAEHEARQRGHDDANG